MFRFGLGEFLFLYALLPGLVVFLWYARRRKQRALARLGDMALIRKLSEAVSNRARLAKGLLALASVGLLVSALARPQFGTRVETLRREGQDIVIALDVSASMLAEDIVPNRLEKAKHALGTLLDRLRGDRVALVAFAGDAFIQSPLTLDYGAARLFLNAMGPDLIPVPGTNLGAALDRSLDAFVAGSRQHKLLVLITDGEDHEGELPTRLERAVDEGVIIYAVGVGSSQGVPIPEFDDQGRRRGFKRDARGEIVTTGLDEVTLQAIAQRTGGRYFRATAGENELAELTDEIAGMEKTELAAQEITQFEEQYQIFLGLALILLLTESLLPERRRVRSAWKGRFA